VDIVIPCYRPGNDLSRLLAEIVQKTEQPYRLHLIAHRDSAAVNRNLGLRCSNGDIVIMLDDDIESLPLYWNRILRILLDEDQSVLAVSARLLQKNGEPGKNTANNTDVNRDYVEVSMIPTACCAFRAPKNGLKFDENFKVAGWEDTDFFTAMKAENPQGKFVIDNRCQVVHRNEEKGGGGAGNLYNRDVFMHKWYSPSRFNNLAGITKRGCIDVGHPCNIDCKMCYHRHEDRSKRRFLPKQEIMARMLRDKEQLDLECIDFTGGEPTLHPDMPEIVAYGRQIGLPVCIISHGQWRNMERMREIFDAGPLEFLMSIHGVAEDHDALVNPGAYEHIMRSIDMLQDADAGIPWRANCVVTRQNHKNLDTYAIELINMAYPPDNVNFIVFNPFAGWSQMKDIDCQEKHSILAPNIARAINILSSVAIWCNVRYFPMCQLPGQEKHVTCFPQIVYDPLEWDVRSYCNLKPEVIQDCYDIGRRAGVWGETDRHIFFNTWSIHNSHNLYRKPPQCVKCRNFLICDGLAVQYRDRYGAGELRPQDGDLIRDPIYYRRGTPGVQS